MAITASSSAYFIAAQGCRIIGEDAKFLIRRARHFYLFILFAHGSLYFYMRFGLAAV